MWEAKVAPLSGVVFGVLLVAGFVVDTNTNFMPPPEDVVDYLAESPVAIMIGAYLRLLAAAALLWFSGSLYKSIRSGQDDDGRLSGLVLAGGAVAAAMFALGSAVIVAAAERVWVTGTIESAAATTLFDVGGIAVGNGVPLGLAVMIAAYGVFGLRTRLRPRWIGWGSLVLALALISPFAWAAVGLAMLWAPAIGVTLYRRGSKALDAAGVM